MPCGCWVVLNFEKKFILEFDYLSNNLTEESVFSLTIAYSFSLTGKGEKRTEKTDEFALNISIKQQFCFTWIFVQMSHKGSSLLSLTAWFNNTWYLEKCTLDTNVYKPI